MRQQRHLHALLPSLLTLSSLILVLVLAGCGANAYNTGPASAAPAAASATATPTTPPAATATTAPATPVTTPKISIQEGDGYYSTFSFAPASVTIKAGTAVVWSNDTSAPHTVTSDTGDPAAFDSGNVSAGSTYTFTFTTPGTYTYHCNIHPYMKGTIVVAAA